MSQVMEFTLMLCGLGFIALGARCWTLARARQPLLRWNWLSAAAAMGAFALWTDVIAQWVASGDWHIAAARALSLAAMLSCLSAFIRRSCQTMGVLPLLPFSVRLLCVLAAGVSQTPLLTEPAGLSVLTFSCAVMVAGIWHVFRAAAARRAGALRSWLNSIGLVFFIAAALEAVLAILFYFEIKIPGPPASTSIQTARLAGDIFAGIFLWAAAVVATAFHEVQLRLHYPRHPRKAAQRLVAPLALLILLAVLTGGWAITKWLVRDAANDMINGSTVAMSHAADQLNAAIRKTRAVVGVGSQSPALVSFLDSPTEEHRAACQELLEQYAAGFHLSLCTLTDRRGRVVAATASAPTGFLGTDLSQHHFFKKATAGKAIEAVEWCQWIQKRSITAVHPVQGADGQVLGMLAVDRDIDPLESQMAGQTRLYLVHDSGLIMLSSDPTAAFHQLGSAPNPVAKEIAGDHWHAASLPALGEVGSRKPMTGDILRLNGKLYQVASFPLAMADWSMLCLQSLATVERHELLGLGLTGVVATLVLAVASLLQMHEKTDLARNEQVQLRHELRGMEHGMAIAVHDLRSPLNATHMIAQYHLAKAASLSPDLREDFATIARETRRLLDYVSAILDAVRLRSPSVVWTWGHYLPQTLAEAACDSVRPLVQPSQVRLDCKAQQPLPPARGDAEAIGRLLVNLLGNAIKHTERGVVELRASQISKAGMDFIRFEVSDTGGGIPPERLQHLGRPFELGGDKSHPLDSAGLGLAISLAICAAHGGSLSVRSRQGEGTVFTADLRPDLEGAATPEQEPHVLVQ